MNKTNKPRPSAYRAMLFQLSGIDSHALNLAGVQPSNDFLLNTIVHRYFGGILTFKKKTTFFVTNKWKRVKNFFKIFNFLKEIRIVKIFREYDELKKKVDRLEDSMKMDIRELYNRSNNPTDQLVKNLVEGRIRLIKDDNNEYKLVGATQGHVQNERMAKSQAEFRKQKKQKQEELYDKASVHVGNHERKISPLKLAEAANDGERFNPLYRDSPYLGLKTDKTPMATIGENECVKTPSDKDEEVEKIKKTQKHKPVDNSDGSEYNSPFN